MRNPLTLCLYTDIILKKGLKSHSGLIDCLWGELYGSINMAEISDGVITAEHANYLRKKYLYGAGI